MKSEKSAGNRPPWLRSVPPDSIPSEDKTKQFLNTRRLSSTDRPIVSNKTKPINLSQLVTNLNVPVTKQSLSALSYALHFGISIKKETIEALMKQVSRLPPQLQEAGLAGSLLALAKGLHLSDSALVRLARLLVPQAEPLTQKAPIHPRDGEAEDTDLPETDKAQEIPLNAAQAALYFAAASKKHPILDLLNRFPHKNSQRQIILPFNFLEDRLEIKGNLRLHCIERPGGPLEVQSLVIDAVSNKHQWYMEAVKNKAGGLVINMQIHPPPGNPESIITTLKTVSDTVTMSFEKPEPFQEFREQYYTGFETLI